MTKPTKQPTTHIATSTATDITVRGKSLVQRLARQGHLHGDDLLPDRSGTSRRPGRRRSSMRASSRWSSTASRRARSRRASSTRARPRRCRAQSRRDSSAWAAGSSERVEGCALLLARIVAASDRRAEAAAIIAEHSVAKRAAPGLRPRHPRTRRPAHAADSSRSRAMHGVAGATSRRSSARRGARRAKRRHITINATGAVAAALGDCGHSRIRDLRGFSVIARCAGLVGHIHEEQREPAMVAMWASRRPRCSLRSERRMTMAPKLYMHPVSTASRPVSLFIAEKKLTSTEQVVDLMKGEHYEDEYSAINPSRMVPVLEDGDFRIDGELGDPQVPRRRSSTARSIPKDLQEARAGRRGDGLVQHAALPGLRLWPALSADLPAPQAADRRAARAARSPGARRRRRAG